MSISPIESSEQHRIGSVNFVSPNEIKLDLDHDSPDFTALNTGTPKSFPRINGYLLVPSEEGFTVGQVEWLSVEQAQFPKRKGIRDFGVIDLPFPQRRISLNPVGTLVIGTEKDKTIYKFKRGVHSFPTVGDPVLLPTDDQLKKIVDSGENRHVLIGHAPLAGNAEVKIDPDRLFGRHLAVLGNTGSGKSCSVAGLIQWSIKAAREKCRKEEPNARFIILDPNGEYRKAFEGLSKKLNIYTASFPNGQNSEDQLKVPLWLWNTEEWSTFTLATARAQKPLIRQTLRSLRNGYAKVESGPHNRIRVFLRNTITSLRKEYNSGAYIGNTGQLIGFGNKLDSVSNSLSELSELAEIEQHESDKLDELSDKFLKIADNRRGGTRPFFNSFEEIEVYDLIESAKEVHEVFGGLEEDLTERDEDVPVQFKSEEFVQLLESLAQGSDSPQFTEHLISRVKTLLNDQQINSIIDDSDNQINFDVFLKNYIGSSNSENINIIDLSFVPNEVVHIVTTVIARVIFESLQRYRSANERGKTLPTVLVMEEAHTFIKRYREDSNELSASVACCKVFERIAREGRKFGLGLVLSSQRPSELSPTVLSQCNSFLLHRISNDRDQDAVSKLLPDHLRGMLRELPVLPTRNAFLLGWVTELPILTRIRELSETELPQSEDPDFWNVWTGKKLDDQGEEIEVQREVNWTEITKKWQRISEEENSSEEQSNTEHTQSNFEKEDDDDLPF